MWTVVFVSQDEAKTKNLVDVLNNNEIITMMQTSRDDDFAGAAAYEILVPQTELEAAQDIIFDIEIKLS